MRPISIRAWLFIMLFGLPALAQGGDWPAVRPMRANFTISESASGFSVNVLGLNKNTLYRLECEPGDYVDEDELDYFGLIQCTLKDVSNPIGDLLASDVDGHAGSRAAFNFYRHDKCATHPYFGAKRLFRLRGMRLELQMSEPKTSDLYEALKEQRNLKQYSFSFAVVLTPDRTAASPSADKYPESCAVVYGIDKMGRVSETVVTSKAVEWYESDERR